MKVLVIGNGFDLYHNLKSPKFIPKIEWKNFVNTKVFKKWLYKNEHSFADTKPDWSDFENALHKLKYSNKKYLLYNQVNKMFELWFEDEIIPKINYDAIPKQSVVQEIIKGIDFCISLNYTKTIQIYGFEVKNFTEHTTSSFFKVSNLKNCAINIHQFDIESKTKRRYIVGSDQEEKYGKDWLIQKWRGAKNWNPKDALLSKIGNYDEFKIDEFIFFGFSFGLSDSKFVKFFYDYSIRNDTKIKICYLEEKHCTKIKKNIKNILNKQKILNTTFVKIS